MDVGDFHDNDTLYIQICYLFVTNWFSHAKICIRILHKITLPMPMDFFSKSIFRFLYKIQDRAQVYWNPLFVSSCERSPPRDLSEKNWK